jgi:hypothetical protein
MSLTKTDIIKAVHTHFDIPKKDCFGIVKSLFDIIKDDLLKVVRFRSSYVLRHVVNSGE